VVGGLSFLFFKLIAAFGLLRSDPKHELMGLDMPEMGALGYSNIDVHMHGVRMRGPGAPPAGGE
jgi:hypothetical protein